MSEWNIATLGDCINIKHGYAFKGEHIIENNNNIVLVTPGNFKIGGGFQEKKCKYFDGDYPKDYVLKPHDFIVTMTDLSKGMDTLGYSAYVPNEKGRIYLHNQRIGLVTIKSNICDKGFLYWLMRNRDYQRFIAGSATGSTVHHTSPSKIYAYKFSYPNILTQKKIAKVLDNYDSLIENYQQQMKLLEEAAQRLYKEWFVDLKFPGHEKVKIVDGVPEGWNYEFVGNLITKTTRTKQIPTSEMLDEGKIPVIDQSKNFIAGYTNDEESVIRTTVPLIVFGDHTRVLKFIVFPFARGADGTQLILSNNLNRMPQSLFFQSLLNVDLSNYSYARHFKYLKAEKIIVPTENIAKKFDTISYSWIKDINFKRMQISLLTEARDRLLPKLMSGEIAV